MLERFSSTKRKLLMILKKLNEGSIKEIMAHFELSEIAIRRHLHDLIRDEFVEEKSIKQEIGRPYKHYRLTTKGHELFPNQYKTLPLELLKDLEALQGKDAVTKLLNKRKEREINHLLSELTETDFDKRVKQFVEHQAKIGYMIDIEKKDNGYLLINYNCPIYNIAISYGQICLNERETLERVFPNCDIISNSQIAQGDRCCKWTIRPKN